MRSLLVKGLGFALIGALAASNLGHPAQAMPEATCDPITANWSATSTSTSPAVPARYPPGGGTVADFQMIFELPTPPPSSIPTCTYAVSDLTNISLTFTTTNLAGGIGGMQWATLQVGNAVLQNNPNYNGPINFAGPFIIGGGTGIGTLSKVLSPDQLDIGLPTNNFILDLLTPLNNFVITSFSGTLSGHHYYVEPEPMSLALLASGLCALVLIRRKRTAS